MEEPVRGKPQSTRGDSSSVEPGREAAASGWASKKRKSRSKRDREFSASSAKTSFAMAFVRPGVLMSAATTA